MDLSPTSSQSAINPSRRSFPNLQHLSLAPLSSRFPLDEDNIDAEYEGYVRQTSYIQSTTAPSTPSILTRSPSQQRRSKKKKAAYYIHEGYIPSSNDASAPITKAKSSSALLASQTTSHSRLPGLSPIASRNTSLSKAATQPQPNDEWMYRAGLAIAEESRLAKGQSWLASRERAAALAAAPPAANGRSSANDEPAALAPSGSRARLALDDESALLDDADPATPRWPAAISRPASRHGAGSRVASRAQSRRGSRGSRLDVALPREAADGYFEGAGVAAAGPDFVELEEREWESGDGEEDDEVVRRLASERAFGLGGVLDRLVGWTLFNVDEDREDSEREEAAESAEDAASRRERDATRRREQLERAASSSALSLQAQTAVDQADAADGEQGAWHDAAWLLSVASKVIL